MKNPNRRKAPDYKVAKGNFELDPQIISLKNNIPVYILKANDHDYIRLDLIFETGHWNCSNPLIADFTSLMLIEGCKGYTSSEIAEKLDFYGSFVNFDCGKHFSNAQLFALSHLFEESIDLFSQIVKFPVFPDKEFNVLITNEIQQFSVLREKTELLASDAFFPRLFGNLHPYGRVRKAEDFQVLDPVQLRTFHRQHYTISNCKIILTGKISENDLLLLDRYFGGHDWTDEFGLNNKTIKAAPLIAGRTYIKKEGAVQASIKIGTITIDKTHPDFIGFSILNTILGGYFGSRLMTNLREENSLTYGIYSSIISFLHSGIFMISANVNGEKAEQAIEQIYIEIDKLTNSPVPSGELKMVKNYLSGEMLRSFDGALMKAEILSGLLNYGLQLDFYNNYIKTLNMIDAATLKNLAINYFKKENFVEVLAGKV
ncbi:MAG: pitrilysin family protein [Bacteroidales bacterium]